MSRPFEFSRLRLAGMLLALASSGCVAGGLDPPSDAWSHPPTEQVANAADWDQIPPERIHEILPAHLPEALAFLADQEILQLTPAQAHQLAGDFRDQPAPLYLVRGLGSPRQGYHRILLIGHDGKTLLVSSGILSHSKVTPERSPVILSLPADPKFVYITAFQAE